MYYDPQRTDAENIYLHQLYKDMKEELSKGNLQEIEPLPDMITKEESKAAIYPDQLTQKLLDIRSNDARLKQLGVPEQMLDMYRKKLDERMFPIRNQLKGVVGPYLPRSATPEMKIINTEPEFY